MNKIKYGDMSNSQKWVDKILNYILWKKTSKLALKNQEKLDFLSVNEQKNLN